MRLILKKREPGSLNLGMIFGMIAVLSLFAARVIPLNDLLPSCTFRGLLGIPCPTCGSTRALTRLVQGDLAGAFSMNPLFCLGLAVVLAWGAFGIASRLARTPQISLSFSGQEGTVLRTALIALVALNWIYLLLHPRL